MVIPSGKQIFSIFIASSLNFDLPLSIPLNLAIFINLYKPPDLGESSFAWKDFGKSGFGGNYWNKS